MLGSVGRAFGISGFWVIWFFLGFRDEGFQDEGFRFEGLSNGWELGYRLLKMVG